MPYLQTPQHRHIAYHRSEGRGPGVVFLGGFKSDMEGSKATYLEAWAKAQGRAFVRFDYSGHGQSSEAFTDGCIGDWRDDALAVLDALCDGPQVLVGSSMGGWISLLIARAAPERIKGLVTIAAAPDFTARHWAQMAQADRDTVLRDGQVAQPSDYGEPYIFTQRLFEDGARQSVLNASLLLPFPVRMVQGTDDTAVPTSEATRLLHHITCPDARLTLVAGKDHSFSDPECLALIERCVTEVLEA
jgi:pimeloyl-ACP methyl ester carboxylesterase